MNMLSRFLLFLLARICFLLTAAACLPPLTFCPCRRQKKRVVRALNKSKPDRVASPAGHGPQSTIHKRKTTALAAFFFLRILFWPRSLAKKYLHRGGRLPRIGNVLCGHICFNARFTSSMWVASHRKRSAVISLSPPPPPPSPRSVSKGMCGQWPND